MPHPVGSPNALVAWASMGYAARVILLVLVAFAGLLFYIVQDRFRAYRRAARPAERTRALAFELRRHLHTLAAIKVTAPLLGLLGTLLGVINGLVGVALTGTLDPHALGSGHGRGADDDRAGPRDRPAGRRAHGFLCGLVGAHPGARRGLTRLSLARGRGGNGRARREHQADPVLDGEVRLDHVLAGSTTTSPTYRWLVGT